MDLSGAIVSVSANMAERMGMKGGNLFDHIQIACII